MSNFSKLSAVRMSGSLDDYKPVGTIPNLQQLNMEFYGDPEDFLDPLPAVCDTGSLTRLTRLEIGSCLVLQQVRILSWHLKYSHI